MADNRLQLRPAMSKLAVAAYANDLLGRLRKLGPIANGSPQPSPANPRGVRNR